MWWPKYPDGHHITHIYRLIDDDHGTDLIFLSMDMAMSHNLQENTIVDFANDAVKQLSLIHI